MSVKNYSLSDNLLVLGFNGQIIDSEQCSDFTPDIDSINTTTSFITK
jgi:hypothetical protein